MTIYDFSYTSIEGNPVAMSEYQGKVLLIVNTASKCGFTPHYKGLEDLYRKYKKDGFVVIGFPCNQFGGQEPSSEAEIADFCAVRYGVDFPLSKKVDVRDSSAHPLFKYLTEQKGFVGLGSGLKATVMSAMFKKLYKESYHDRQIKWNFTKFLIDKNGNVINRYEPTTKLETIAPAIEKLL
ncbi:MAG: glutathione peroxidase [Treponema sp.]|jgi:glutathione peroxidase|nr:glutathione peroxidase [Treponema sp.]